MMKIKVRDELNLHPIQLSDAKDIFHIINTQREYLGRWLPFVHSTKEISDTENFIESSLKTCNEKQEYVFCIKKNEQFIGLISFVNTDKKNKKTKIGYWISQNFQKQGIVTLCVQKICEFAFEKLNMNRVQICCNTENIPRVKAFPNA